ncbi:MAG: type VI secretion system-associated protein TagF [Burkholderiales bacterium]|jgi:type VI secretion system protein ImpM|nr:type VI secretion system-associated protein TagF [Burkholderiales bacterium]
MNRGPFSASVSYFGKLAARGDFVKSTGNLPLVSSIDQWVSGGMELLAQDPRWKMVYDGLSPLDFIFLGSRRHLAIAGHIQASQDASQRRFPFLTVATIEVEQPLRFLARSPMVMSTVWSKLNSMARSVMAASDPAELLHSIASNSVVVETDSALYEGSFTDFIEFQTIATLEAMLDNSGRDISLRRIFLALGLLLQPVMASGASRLGKGLRLPLPADATYRPIVASIWMELISRFLAHADFELVLFFSHAESDPAMVLGFDGASAQTLHSMMDPMADEQYNIDIFDPEWADAQLRSDYGIAKLASYMAQPHLNLKLCIDTFREAFVGG